MRCRSTKEACALVAEVLVGALDSNEPDQMRFDHAAVQMVRSKWWVTWPNEMIPGAERFRGQVRVPGKTLFCNRIAREIPWR